eukprot:6022935-Pleurochrysis_carterae.AAC.1
MLHAQRSAKVLRIARGPGHVICQCSPEYVPARAATSLARLVIAFKAPHSEEMGFTLFLKAFAGKCHSTSLFISAYLF